MATIHTWGVLRGTITLILLGVIVFADDSEGKDCDWDLPLSDRESSSTSSTISIKCTSSTNGDPNVETGLACWNSTTDNGLEQCAHLYINESYSCRLKNNDDGPENEDRVNKYIIENGFNRTNCLLERLYAIGNNYDYTLQESCKGYPRGTFRRIMELLKMLKVTPNWTKIRSVAVLCFLTGIECDSPALTARMTGLMEEPSTHISTQMLNNNCCSWDTGCMSLHKTISSELCKSAPPDTYLNCTGSVTTSGECPDCPVEATFEKLSNISATAKGRPKFNAILYDYADRYTGPVVDMLRLSSIATILPRERIRNLTISDIDNFPGLFIRLPDPKKLALTNQTLLHLGDLDRETQIATNFQNKGCGFLPSIGVDILNTPGLLTRQLAVDMCNCNEAVLQTIPTKVNILCETIFVKVDDFDDFKSLLGDDLCPVCLYHVLQRNPDWKNQVLADTELRKTACDKIGSSFILPPAALSEWAMHCTDQSQAGGCLGVRISLLSYQPSRQTSGNLAACSEGLCEGLCSLTGPMIDIIRRVLSTPFTDNVGCLGYLEGVQRPTVKAQVNATAISGNCTLKSRVVREWRPSTPRTLTGRRRRQTCSITCDDIRNDISYGVNPPDVLDTTVIEECVTSDGLLGCIKETELGDYQWDQDQARALYDLILMSGSFTAIENWSSSDLQILGYIGLAFTPKQLDDLEDLTTDVYAVFGAAYGWSPDQLRTLAARYLRDNNVTPEELTGVHLARLNHLICGLTREQVRRIRLTAIRDTSAILGMMRRCEIDVIKVIANRLKLLHGPVKYWAEDNFSEYGIILAGLTGEELKDVGPKLADYITVPVVNHIPPGEFRKLGPEQTVLFDYQVALAIRQRGLCAWLSDRHRGRGYLEQTCAGSGATSHIRATLLTIVASLLVALLHGRRYT